MAIDAPPSLRQCGRCVARANISAMGEMWLHFNCSSILVCTSTYLPDSKTNLIVKKSALFDLKICSLTVWLWVGKRAGGGASQAVDVGGQKRRQAAAEAVVEVSGGGGGRVECAIGNRVEEAGGGGGLDFKGAGGRGAGCEGG